MPFANGIGKMQAIAKDDAPRGLFWLGFPRAAQTGDCQDSLSFSSVASSVP
jgi:hypothetical protein